VSPPAMDYAIHALGVLPWSGAAVRPCGQRERSSGTPDGGSSRGLSRMSQGSMAVTFCEGWYDNGHRTR
jgi:hypothetical protein